VPYYIDYIKLLYREHLRSETLISNTLNPEPQTPNPQP
jgi:hypothetical protein